MNAVADIAIVDVTKPSISAFTFKQMMKRGFFLQRQSLPLEAKIQISLQRIRQWYEHYDGEVYIALSGGKDSTVLADLVWSIYPDVPAVFSNTGLEYPEIVQFVKELKAEGKPIFIIRPKRTFRDVVLNDGFPLVSKKVAEMVQRLRRPAEEKNAATRTLYLTGIKRDGTFSKTPKSLISGDL